MADRNPQIDTRAAAHGEIRDARAVPGQPHGCPVASRSRTLLGFESHQILALDHDGVFVRDRQRIVARCLLGVPRKDESVDVNSAALDVLPYHLVGSRRRLNRCRAAPTKRGKAARVGQVVQRDRFAAGDGQCHAVRDARQIVLGHLRGITQPHRPCAVGGEGDAIRHLVACGVNAARALVPCRPGDRYQTSARVGGRDQHRLIASGARHVDACWNDKRAGQHVFAAGDLHRPAARSRDQVDNLLKVAFGKRYHGRFSVLGRSCHG